MAIAPLGRHSVIEYKGERLKLIRPFEKGIWQLENISSGRLAEHPYDELLEGIRTGNARIVLDEELLQESSPKKRKAVPPTRWESLTKEAQAVARRRERYVKAAINSCRSRKIVCPKIAEVAKQLNDQNPPSFSTLMEWISTYIRGGFDITALVPRHRHRGRTSTANEILERVVDQQIEDVYLKRERQTLRDTHEVIAAEVDRRNKLLPEGDPQLPIPSIRYLRTRLAKYSSFDICAARYGKEYAARKYITTLGFSMADKPLERVEIDHTVLDLMVIDDQTGLPLGRPTLTVALDCATRCIHGFHVGFEPPSYLAVSRCLNHALLPKTYLKSEYPDIDGDWPCFGAMEYLVVDNGLEFHADALESAARQFGITIQYCPRAKPWFKGKVERFIGTMNRAVAHGKPGTTFENIFERGDYDSKKTATITLSVLKHLIHIWVIKYYHQRVHSSIHKRPDTAWKEGIEVTKIPVPVGLKDFEAAFAVPETRRLDKNGIKIFCLEYNGDACTEYRLKHGPIQEEAAIRYVPDDLGHIYLEDPITHEMARVPVAARFAEYATGLTSWQHEVCKRYARKHYETDDIVALGQAKQKIIDLVQSSFSLKKIAKSATRFKHASKTPLATDSSGSASSRGGKKAVLNNAPLPLEPMDTNTPQPDLSMEVVNAPRGAPKPKR